MKNIKKTALTKEAKQKIKGGFGDDLNMFDSVKAMDSMSSLVKLNGEEFLALKGKTHRNEPIDR